MTTSNGHLANSIGSLLNINSLISLSTLTLIHLIWGCLVRIVLPSEGQAIIYCVERYSNRISTVYWSHLNCFSQKSISHVATNSSRPQHEHILEYDEPYAAHNIIIGVNRVANGTNERQLVLVDWFRIWSRYALKHLDRCRWSGSGNIHILFVLLISLWRICKREGNQDHICRWRQHGEPLRSSIWDSNMRGVSNRAKGRGFHIRTNSIGDDESFSGTWISFPLIPHETYA